MSPELLPQLSLLVLALPLAGFSLLIFFGKRLPRQGDWLETGIITTALGLSLYILLQKLTLFHDEALRITAVPANHHPVKHAFGFVFEGGGRKLALSGDTAYCPALIEAARGADALVHECFIHREMKPAPGRSPEGIRNVASYHTLSGEVGRVAAEARVKLLALNHFVPTKFDRAALVAEVRETWRGPLVIGEDLTRYDCDSRMLQHGGATLGIALD